MMLVLQIGVLLLTVLLWWRARQDIASRVSGLPPAAEWERLRQTVEQLTADLERRAVVAEQRVSAAEASLEARLAPLSPETGEPKPTWKPLSANLAPPLSAAGASSAPTQNAAYAAADSLIAQGATDPHIIAREAGIERGEAELLLSLRARRT